jgi:hypothetical protein
VRRVGATVARALVAGVLLGGCASGTTVSSVTPLCRSGDGSAAHGVIVMAQSVPGASWVPCIGAALPLGWDFHGLDARNGGSRFWLDSDRDGMQAVEVRLTRTCATTGASEIPSDREGMRRLERVDRIDPTYAGRRFYLFDGGCLTIVFALQGDSPGEALAVASQVVDVISRDDLAAQVREASRGRLSLDPATRGEG